MSPYEKHISRIDLYLDDELRGEQLEVFNRHINECGPCRREFAERRRFLEQIRAARPLYTPSAKFRTEMSALLAVPERRPTKTGAAAWLIWFRSKPIPAFIACALAVAAIVTVWRVSLRDAHANAFVDLAVETYREQAARHLPLEIRTNSEKEISNWFAERVPFHFRLPSSQKPAEQHQVYELTGGSVVTFRSARAAYVAYRMQGRLISLLVTSTAKSVALGGDETISKGLTFHTHRRGELQVVTWSVHNLTYALVSGVNVAPGQSCVVCHASAKERDLIQGLRSLNNRRANGGSQIPTRETDIRRLLAM